MKKEQKLKSDLKIIKSKKYICIETTWGLYVTVTKKEAEIFLKDLIARDKEYFFDKRSDFLFIDSKDYNLAF